MNGLGPVVDSTQTGALSQDNTQAKKGFLSKIPRPFSSEREPVGKGKIIAAVLIGIVGFGGAAAAGVMVSPFLGAAIAVATLVAIYFALLTGKKKPAESPKPQELVVAPSNQAEISGRVEFQVQQLEHVTAVSKGKLEKPPREQLNGRGTGNPNPRVAQLNAEIQARREEAARVKDPARLDGKPNPDQAHRINPRHIESE